MMGYFELHDFVENQRLDGVIYGNACRGCEADGCDGCDGHGAMEEIESQIYDEALKLMKSLAEEWIKGSIA